MASSIYAAIRKRSTGVNNSWLPSSESGLALWLRGDLGITSSLGSISGWADQSGNGYNASQLAPPNKPNTSTGINGKATVLFNGFSSFMILPAMTTPANAQTVVFVSKMTATPGAAVFYALFSYFISSTTYNALYFTGTGSGYSPTIFQFSYTSSTQSEGINDTLDTNATKRVFIFDGVNTNATSSYSSTTNNVSQTIVSGTAFGAAISAIGSDSAPVASNPFNGYIGEIIIWDHVLNATALSNLNNYLVNYWGA